MENMNEIKKLEEIAKRIEPKIQKFSIERDTGYFWAEYAGAGESLGKVRGINPDTLRIDIAPHVELTDMDFIALGESLLLRD